MSYQSRVYRQRNAHTHDEAVKDPFFTKQNDINKAQKASFFQAKLSVNEPGDKYEKEADTVANAVVNNSNQTPAVQQNSIQKLSADPEKEKKEGIQKMDMPLKEDEKKKLMKPVQKKQEGNAVAASPQISSKIEQSSGRGKALPAKTLHQMNSSFGVDFSNVRIHNDSEAAGMNKELNAQAFTHGSDIYFNEGKYNPENSQGKFLLAHELTHVVQQEMFADDGIQKSPAAAVVIGAALLAAVSCAYAFYNYALNHFPGKNDTWKHCWVSCKITAWCGGDAIALIVGAGKEGLDAICDAYGKGCKAEFRDFLADLEGIACGNIPLLPCTTCCDKVGASAL